MNREGDREEKKGAYLIAFNAKLKKPNSIGFKELEIAFSVRLRTQVSLNNTQKQKPKISNSKVLIYGKNVMNVEEAFT